MAAPEPGGAGGGRDDVALTLLSGRLCDESVSVVVAALAFVGGFDFGEAAAGVAGGLPGIVAEGRFGLGGSRNALRNGLRSSSLLERLLHDEGFAFGMLTYGMNGVFGGGTELGGDKGLTGGPALAFVHGRDCEVSIDVSSDAGGMSVSVRSGVIGLSSSMLSFMSESLSMRNVGGNGGGSGGLVAPGLGLGCGVLTSSSSVVAA